MCTVIQRFADGRRIVVCDHKARGEPGAHPGLAALGPPSIQRTFIQILILLEAVCQQFYRFLGSAFFFRSQVTALSSFSLICGEAWMQQVENHPFLTQMKLVEFCKKHGIAVTAFSPLGGSGSARAK